MFKREATDNIGGKHLFSVEFIVILEDGGLILHVRKDLRKR